MSDSFGAIALPLPAPTAGTPVSDPALDTLLSFLQATFNAQATAAWDAVAPSKTGDPPAPLVAHIFTHDPRERWFNHNQTPALYLFRAGGGRFGRDGEDLDREQSPLTLLWIFPHLPKQDVQRLRDPIINGISKVLRRALEEGRHPAWVVATDLADADAIKTSIATSTTSQTYSGVALNGTIGGGVVYAARPVTITRSLAVGAYSTTDPVEFTGLLADGSTFTDEIYFPNANGGDTLSGIWPLSDIEQIFVPAQVTTAGSFTFGYADSPEVELGSLVKRYAGLSGLRLEAAGKQRVLTIQAKDTTSRQDTDRNYLMIEFEISIEEIFTEDLASHYTAVEEGEDPGSGFGPASMFIDIRHEDGTSLETFYVE